MQNLGMAAALVALDASLPALQAATVNLPENRCTPVASTANPDFLSVSNSPTSFQYAGALLSINTNMAPTGAFVHGDLTIPNGMQLTNILSQAKFHAALSEFPIFAQFPGQGTLASGAVNWSGSSVPALPAGNDPDLLTNNKATIYLVSQTATNAQIVVGVPFTVSAGQPAQPVDDAVATVFIGNLPAGSTFKAREYQGFGATVSQDNAGNLNVFDTPAAIWVKANENGQTQTNLQPYTLTIEKVNMPYPDPEFSLPPESWQVMSIPVAKWQNGAGYDLQVSTNVAGPWTTESRIAANNNDGQYIMNPYHPSLFVRLVPPPEAAPAPAMASAPSADIVAAARAELGVKKE